MSRKKSQKDIEINSRVTARLIRKSSKPSTWINKCYPKENAMDLELKWAERKKRMFAKFCWNMRGKTAPCGLRWEKVFEEKEGKNLFEFVADLMRKKL